MKKGKAFWAKQPACTDPLQGRGALCSGNPKQPSVTRVSKANLTIFVSLFFKL